MNIQNRIKTFRENFFSLKALFIFITLFAVYSVFFYSVGTQQRHVSNPDLWALLATAFVGAITFIFIIALSAKNFFKNFDIFDVLDIIYIIIAGVAGGVAGGVVGGVVGVVVVGGVVGVVCIIGFVSVLGSFIALAMASATAYGDWTD